jgi:hypothetical protein
MGGVGLGEDGPDRGGDHLRRPLGHPGQHVAQEVDPAALDGRPGHDRVDGLAQPQVGVGDDQLHSAQPTRLQRAKEGGPERAVLRIADAEAEDLAAAVAAHPSRHYHRLGHHPAVDPGLAVGGVHEHIGKHLAGQRSIPDAGHLGGQVGADA